MGSEGERHGGDSHARDLRENASWRASPGMYILKMSMREAETDLSELLQGRLGANLRARDLDGPGGDGYAEGGLHLRY